MLATARDLAGNGLLSILRPEDQERLAPHMSAFDLEADAVLHDAGEDVVHTWFPCHGALAAYMIAADGGDVVEVALIGREGAVGGIVSNGRLPAYASAHVRFGGRFLRIDTIALEKAKVDSLSLRHWFARYSDCLLAQVFQTAACNATHTIVQRVAKWFLIAMERTGSKEFAMTQEHFAEMLGVGRTFVTRVIKKLRDDKVIETRRGFFRVRSEAALRALACDCAGKLHQHYDAVLQGLYDD